MKYDKQILKVVTHVHESEPGEIVKLEFNNKLKNRCLTTKESFDDALSLASADLPEHNTKNLESNESMRDTFNRRRKQANIKSTPYFSNFPTF